MDGNCLEKLPSGYNFRQMDGKTEAKIPSEIGTDILDGNWLAKGLTHHKCDSPNRYKKEMRSKSEISQK
ncbi:MAG: hypothetical protein ACOYBD_09715 [Bilifractor sp.]